MLLKTSRGLKLSTCQRTVHWQNFGFSALEDEPWIEAPKRLSYTLPRYGFSALEDEPWIEAPASSHAASYNICFSALEDEPWIEACAVLR